MKNISSGRREEHKRRREIAQVRKRGEQLKFAWQLANFDQRKRILQDALRTPQLLFWIRRELKKLERDGDLVDLKSSENLVMPIWGDEGRRADRDGLRRDQLITAMWTFDSMKNTHEYNATKPPVPWRGNTVAEAIEVLVRWQERDETNKRKRAEGSRPPPGKKGAAGRGRHQSHHSSAEFVASLIKKFKGFWWAMSP